MSLFPWQRMDPKLGVAQPWYTHPSLDVIQAWDLADKAVLEWGGGHSTIWWGKRARRVFTIEAHQDWTDTILAELAFHDVRNVTVERRWPDPLAKYLEVPADLHPDIVIVDGSERTNCLKAALALPRPLTVIFDNWQQDSVYIDADAEVMMATYPGKFYVQPDHKDHQGRPWQTAIWHLE